jgi:hypothetical protein
MASEYAMKVKCPHCNQMNVFREEPEQIFPHWVAKEIPIYTLDEASNVAEKLLAENTERVEGWEALVQNYEGIETAHTKAIAVNQNKELIYATKVTSHINCSINQIFDCYWDPRGEMIWNTASISKIEILKDNGSDQLVHYQLKKNPTINLQNDIVIRRSNVESHKQRWIYCVSEKTNPESQPGWVRGIVPFGGVLIQSIEPQRCKVSWIWAFDINKKLSVKSKDEEPKKVALRLCKLKKKIEDDLRLIARSKEYEAQKSKGFDNN